MILTDSMLDSAFRFRAAEPWSELTDSDIFAVCTSCGTVYCSVMGNGGEHHSLGIYIGDRGFTTYLNTLLLNEKSPLEAMLGAITFDCINCDFMQAKDIDDEVKKVIRQYVGRHGIKIPRKFGWIDFTRFTPYRGQWCITNEDDAKIAEEALRAATFFADNFHGKNYDAVRLDSLGEYPPVEGGKQIPLVTPHADGSYTISRTVTPPFIEYEYVQPVFSNQILAHRTASMKHTADVECRLLHIPAPMMSQDGEPPVYPGVFIMTDSCSGDILLPLTTTDYPDDPDRLLTELANHLYSLGLHPRRMTVSDECTRSLLADFCKKCDIELETKATLPNLEEVCAIMVQQMMMGMM